MARKRSSRTSMTLRMNRTARAATKSATNVALDNRGVAGKEPRDRSAFLLRVVVLEQLSLFRAFAECLGLLLGASGQQSHLALQREQLLVRGGLHLDSLKLLDEGIA